LDVSEEVLADDFSLEGVNGRGDVRAGGLDGDAVIRIEVNAGGLLDFLFKKLAFKAFVGAGVTVVAFLWWGATGG